MHLQLNDISKSYDGHAVLEGVSFTLNEHDRLGFIGKNGSGKSTLFKIIAGLEKPEGGGVTLQPTHASIGYIPQAPVFDAEDTVVRFLMDSLEEWEEYRVDTVLDTLEIPQIKESPLITLSSGQKTKVFLARLILHEPDILLLDEPTNHLDTEALQWLEEYVQQYRGAVCVISHDRQFLDNTVTSIAELDGGMITLYGGNYSSYREQKEVHAQAHARAYESQRKEITRLERQARKRKATAEKINADRKPTRDNDAYAPQFFADRASKKVSAAANSIEKRLAHMERVEKPSQDMQLRALFTPVSPSAGTVVSLKEVTHHFDGAPVLSAVDLTIRRGERVALVGPNGAGKSTLLKIICGELAADAGEVAIGNNVVIGYLSQEHAELDSERSLIEELMLHAGVDKTNAYKLLARFLLPMHTATQSVKSLSSGEKAKLLLAKVMAAGANLIILDEPTNHLDISSREALEEILAQYDGTLLVVSHDRFFMKNIGVTMKMRLEEGILEKGSL